MTSLAAAPWRMRVSPHGATAAGFLIAPRLALTCWHVVAEHRGQEIGVTLAGPERWSGVVPPGDVEQVSISVDVAMLRLPAGMPDVTPAPIGPAEPPEPGTGLVAFGFPLIGDTPAAKLRDNPGLWSRVVVEGLDLAAEQVWLTSADAHNVRIQPGFSGGPVADPASGLVVGITASAWVKQSAALMIPVAALAAGRADLRHILFPASLADPDFIRGGEALDARNYQAALADFRAVCARRPDNPDAWYYVALAALRGQRPRAHTTTYVEEVDRLLEHASSLPSARPHVLALRALIREDHHQSRGITSAPTAADLYPPANSVPLDHAAEICRHVPAPETFIWQELHRWRST